MQYPDEAVRTAIYNLLALAGVQSFDSEAPAGVSSPYVLLQSQVNVPYNTKSGFGFLHSINLAAVVVGPAGTGKAEAEKLLNKALSALTRDKPNDPEKIVLDSPFRCWQVSAGTSKDLAFTSDTETVYQKITTLELTIETLP